MNKEELKQKAIKDWGVPVPKKEEIRKTALDAAKEIIYGDREKVYGAPDKNLAAIALLWSQYLVSRGVILPGANMMTSQDVCCMMVLLKMAREANSHSDDNVIDAIGYLALIDRIRNGD